MGIHWSFQSAIIPRESLHEDYDKRVVTVLLSRIHGFYSVALPQILSSLVYFPVPCKREINQSDFEIIQVVIQIWIKQSLGFRPVDSEEWIIGPTRRGESLVPAQVSGKVNVKKLFGQDEKGYHAHGNLKFNMYRKMCFFHRFWLTASILWKLLSNRTLTVGTVSNGVFDTGDSLNSTLRACLFMYTRTLRMLPLESYRQRHQHVSCCCFLSHKKHKSPVTYTLPCGCLFASIII